jgi:hypothetical protein
MAYDNPTNCCYNFPEMDFGATAGNTVHRIAGPAGKQGRVVEVGIVSSEAFACDATNAKVQVGTSSDADAYAELNIADGTANDAVFNSGNDSDAVISADITKDTPVFVTLVEGTDGSAVTGKGFPYVIIDWF